MASPAPLRSLGSASEPRAFARARTLFREAAQRVPAYRNFLKKHGIDAKKIRSREDFAHVPLTDKLNYIAKYSLAELSWDGKLQAKYISSSSGSTGVPFYWPRGTNQDTISGLTFRRVYEDIFGSRHGRTLCVNSYALGTWLAGFELYNSTKWVAEHGSVIVSTTPGIDKAVTMDVVKKLSPSFERIVLAGYPPFVKDIIEHGISNKFKWKDHDIRLITAGEAVSELWRSHVLGLIGKSGSLTSLTNMYGMAETGIVAHETPASILLRQTAEHTPELCAKLPDLDQVAGLYQYAPLARYFETVQDSLVLTTDAGLPLIRYDTHDRGSILPHTAVERFSDGLFTKTARERGISLAMWKSPYLFMYDRKDLAISFYALLIYVEHVKRAFESYKSASKLSGLFTMSVGHTKTMDQQFTIVVELARHIKPQAGLAKDIARHTVHVLCNINSEYAKLYRTLGKRAEPNIELVWYGKIQTSPGKKHRWIRRS